MTKKEKRGGDYDARNLRTVVMFEVGILFQARKGLGKITSCSDYLTC
jgi:hypothetical protein